MLHSGDMSSSGLCLMKKGWFGNYKDGYSKQRIALYVLLSLSIILLKIGAIYIVQSSFLTYMDSYNESQELYEL